MTELTIENKIKEIKKILSAVLLTIAAVICPVLIYLKYTSIALGIMAGAGIGTANLCLLIWSGKRILKMPPHKTHSFSMAMTFIRILIFALAFLGVMLNKKIEPIITVMTYYFIYQSLAWKEFLPLLRQKLQKK